MTSRAFRPDPVSSDDVLRAIEPALAAPSWANTQPWEIFVAAGQPLERIRKVCAELLAQGAPCCPDIAIPDNLAIAIALGCPDPQSPQNRFKSTRRRAGEVVRMAGL